jgi:cobalt-zinc-cadmium efflux system protein
LLRRTTINRSPVLAPTALTTDAEVPLEPGSQYRRIYLRAWLLSLAIIGIELIGARLSGSFALRADVWHVAGDMLVAITPLALTFARAHTLHLARLQWLGGVAVALVLVAIGIGLMVEARHDLSAAAPPHEVHGWLLTGFALLGAAANLAQHRLLSQVADAHRDVSHVGFHFHVQMDFVKNLALPALGALIALNLIPQRADNWAALCIGAWIVARGFTLMSASVRASRRRER